MRKWGVSTQMEAQGTATTQPCRGLQGTGCAPELSPPTARLLRLSCSCTITCWWRTMEGRGLGPGTYILRHFPFPCLPVKQAVVALSEKILRCWLLKVKAREHTKREEGIQGDPGKAPTLSTTEKKRCWGSFIFSLPPHTRGQASAGVGWGGVGWWL